MIVTYLFRRILHLYILYIDLGQNMLTNTGLTVKVQPTAENAEVAENFK